MHLYITETDSTGYPRLLPPPAIVLDGPTVVHTDGDGVHPTPFHWEFDPPVVLPRPGTYVFFLAMDPCLVYFDVLSTGEDRGLYPDGILWLSGRTGGCDLSGQYADAFPRADLIFKIEFCRSATTPVRPTSWGKLKVNYR
jgi:hypothetical protein